MGFPNLRAEGITLTILVQNWHRFFLVGVFRSGQGVAVHLQAEFHDRYARKFPFLLVSQ